MVYYANEMKKKKNKINGDFIEDIHLFED